jgi:nucleotide-binding universal stress UspA family protein
MRYQRIAVALDGSEDSWKAFEQALDIATCEGAELHLISVIELPHYAATVGETSEDREEGERYFRQVHQQAQEKVQGRAQLQSHILVGHEVETLINFVREKKFDLLAIGYMGHSRVFGRIWGGTSQNLAKLSPCSVLLAK